MSDLQKFLQTAIDTGVFPGAAVAVVFADDIFTETAGNLMYSTSAAVTPNTICDIASITKTVPTALLLHQLAVQGTLDFDSPLDAYLDVVEKLGSISIGSLMRQEVDFGLQLSRYANLTADELWEVIRVATPRPSKDRTFTNAPWLVLGKVIEAIAEQPLHQVATERIFAPLSMEDTSYIYSIELERTAPTEFSDRENQYIQGRVHDESAWVFGKERIAVGSAGVFSTLTDVATLVQDLLQGGPKLGLSSEYVQQMWQDGSGWQRELHWMGTDHQGRVGKSGFTGTMMVIDPDQKRGLVMLSNAIHPLRPEDRSHLDKTRAQFCDIVFARD